MISWACALLVPTLASYSTGCKAIYCSGSLSIYIHAHIHIHTYTHTHTHTYTHYMKTLHACSHKILELENIASTSDHDIMLASSHYYFYEMYVAIISYIYRLQN